jgi:hypothetical protein
MILHYIYSMNEKGDSNKTTHYKAHLLHLLTVTNPFRNTQKLKHFTYRFDFSWLHKIFTRMISINVWAFNFRLLRVSYCFNQTFPVS